MCICSPHLCPSLAVTTHGLGADPAHCSLPGLCPCNATVSFFLGGFFRGIFEQKTLLAITPCCLTRGFARPISSCITVAVEVSQGDLQNTWLLLIHCIPCWIFFFQMPAQSLPQHGWGPSILIAQAFSLSINLSDLVQPLSPGALCQVAISIVCSSHCHYEGWAMLCIPHMSCGCQCWEPTKLREKFWWSSITFGTCMHFVLLCLLPFLFSILMGHCTFVASIFLTLNYRLASHRPLYI